MPNLQFKAYLKNGFIHNGKQKYACKDCGRQFIDNKTKAFLNTYGIC